MELKLQSPVSGTNCSGNKRDADRLTSRRSIRQVRESPFCVRFSPKEAGSDDLFEPIHLRHGAGDLSRSIRSLSSKPGCRAVHGAVLLHVTDGDSPYNRR
jgi:hypothetical protein